MIRRRFSIALVLLLGSAALAATPAVFRGKVVELAQKQPAPGTIFVLSRNGSLRQVKIEGAQVEYGAHIPQRLRKPQPQQSLVHGVEVRVEAEENGAGLWHARQIEILRVPGSPALKEPAAPPEQKPAPTLSRRSG